MPKKIKISTLSPKSLYLEVQWEVQISKADSSRLQVIGKLAHMEGNYYSQEQKYLCLAAWLLLLSLFALLL